MDRFLERVPERPDFGCWLWRGTIMYNGYGHLTHAYAHRISYELFKGPIPDGLTIDHLCREKRCVNPAHLEAVTNSENVKRAAKRPTHCFRGHPFDGVTMTTRSGPRRYCKECSRQRDRESKQRRRNGLVEA